jgi:hypothetical protein
MPLQNDGGW